MKRIALFQFHRDWEVCANHLQLLRSFNPGIEIHGLFGGGEERLKEAEEALGGDLTSLYLLRDRESRWKWQNTDLAVREWFRDVGHRAGFDVVNVVQWDLLFFDSLPNLYRSIPPGALGLTGITSVEKSRTAGTGR